MKKRYGFTLIELLVVIAIIAMLMSILMPALASVKEQAKEVICRKNLQQLAVMWSMYCNNNNSMFHDGQGGDQSPSKLGSTSWMYCLKPYFVEYGDHMTCPSTNVYVKNPPPGKRAVGYAEGNRLIWGVNDASDNASNRRLPIGSYASYGENHYIYSGHPTAVGVSGEPSYWGTPNVKEATVVPVMGGTWSWRTPSLTYANLITPARMPYAGYISNTPDIARWLVNRHKMSINMIFADWSVKKVPLKTLWKIKWSKDWPKDYAISGYDVSGNSGQGPPWLEKLKNADLE